MKLNRVVSALLAVIPALAATTADAGAAVPTTDSIAWHACTAEQRDGVLPADLRPDVRCADVSVPVDHTRPDGRTITVSVTHIPATGERAGVVFGNPGGPGVDARGMWRAAADTPGTGPHAAGAYDDLNRTHDLVAVQPRGLRGSGAITCPGIAPTTPYAQRAAACHRADPQLVSSLTTENVVRDTDLVREKMGLDRISFVGYSYGTAIGMAYQSLFPAHLDRLVLDSPVGPSWLW